jgi:gliding motility-associated-like protein
MIHIFKYLLLFVFIVSFVAGRSQNQEKKWYFGNYGALDFTTNPPTSLANGTMTTWEGCSSVADASGNLLFYTNGVKVWNKSHAVMANGTGLFGNNGSSQSALIVKQPGNTSIYFIFTTDGGANGLNYSVVDMNLAAGMGSVTAKNLHIYSPSTERLCGTRHCNGSDIWVISHDNSSGDFRANLVTAAGVNTTAVVSTAGTALYGSNYIGCMKVSPNGKKIGTAHYRPPFAFELFDFNSATGVVSNALNLPVTSPAYGCEFSPDGTKFYGVLWASNAVTNRLLQWDLCSGSNQAVIGSQSSFNATHTGQLQLGPDGKIYQARAVHSTMKISPELRIELMAGEPMLGVIHNPNASAALLNFNNTGQAVGPALSMFGLPNFVSGFYQTPVTKFTYSYSPAVSCLKAFFAAPPLINASCAATSYTVDNLKWLFDDPASGTANTSSLVNPEHSYPSVGTYKVKLILYNACGGVIDTLRQNVVVGGAFLNKASDFSLCKGQSLTLVAAATSTNYSWSTGATSASIVVTPTANTTYSLSFTDIYGCLRKSVETLTVSPTPTLSFSGRDSLCAGNIFTLTVKGAMTYSWSSGSTNSVIKVLPASTTAYTVTGTSFMGCTTTKVITAVVKDAPVPVVTGNTIACAGNVATMTAVGNAQFLWNTGMQGATFTVIPNDDQYIFSVKATYTNGCSRYNNKVRFALKPLPKIAVTGASTLCAGESVKLTAGGAKSFTWSNGSSANPVLLAPLTDTFYSVAGTDSNNCVNQVWFQINVKSSAALTATVSGNVTICEGQNTYISAGGGNRYEWRPGVSPIGPGNNVVAVSPSVTTIYTVVISNDAACGSLKTVIVHVKPRPELFAGRDTIFNMKEPMYINASGTGTITWIGGDDISCTACPNTRIFPVRRTCYLAQATGPNGCVAFDEVCIDVGQQFALYIPNTFTPDGDGLNDEFFVSGFGISDVRLTIFDRLGEKLYTNNDYKGWDGNYKGQACHAGTYTWIVEYLSATGLRQQKTGYINLLR